MVVLSWASSRRNRADYDGNSAIGLFGIGLVGVGFWLDPSIIGPVDDTDDVPTDTVGW